MPKLPVSPMKVASLVGEVRELAHGPSRLLVTGADAEAVEKTRKALSVESWEDAGPAHAPVKSIVPDGDAGLPREAFSKKVAAVVVVASAEELTGDEFKGWFADLSRADKPVVVVLKNPPGIEVSFPGVGPGRVVGMSMDGTPPADLLAKAVVDAAGDQAAALAARLPVLREEACRQIVRRTARQNAVIGCLFIIPGADMPVMTINEARMVLRLAAAHGEDVGAERTLELLGVVGAGFGLRAIARQALVLLPGPGWIIKGSVAYGGTRAIGRTARIYFDSPRRLTPSRLAPLVEKLKRLRRR
ncbi:MAG: hypothetical protein IBX61_04865 [Thermoleophilia bacterium]|nr:hypothetical protein [Thermoleophilia bacterium]